MTESSRDKTLQVMARAIDEQFGEVISQPGIREIATLALTALEASGRAVVPGWQPIESAPKDGTVVDLWLGNDEDPHRRTDCYWGRPYHSCGEAGQYCDSCPPDHDMWCDPMTGGYEEELQPTHWMHPAASPYGKAVVQEDEQARLDGLAPSSHGNEGSDQ